MVAPTCNITKNESRAFLVHYYILYYQANDVLAPACECVMFFFDIECKTGNVCHGPIAGQGWLA